jgi:tetratricopeptide (TPR) repeat protein
MSIMSWMRTRSAAVEKEAARHKQLTVECLERSLGFAPHYLFTHRLLIDAHKHWKNRADCESAAKRLLEHFPEDLETLTLLADALSDREQLDEAMVYLQKARTQKPLDESLRAQEEFIRIGLARQRALLGQWEEGLAQFRAAEELSPTLDTQYGYLARKALFEAKASNPEESNQFLKQAEAALDDPTPLWLVLAIESIRYQMNAETKIAYAQLLSAGLKKKCRSQTAGELASTLDAYRIANVAYSDRSVHISQVITYLKRTTRLKYRKKDIENVCRFLSVMAEQKQLFVKLLNLGLKQHPESALLNLQAGMRAAADSTPPFIIPAARTYVEKALKLAEASTTPAETALLPGIKSALTLINELSRARGGHPFADGPFGFPMDEDDPFEFFDDDDFGYDPFDDECESAPRSTARPRPKKKKKQKKR